MELTICVVLFREEVTTEKQMHIFIFNNVCDLNASIRIFANHKFIAETT